MPHKPGIGAILGVVSEDGVAKEDFPVTLLDRTTGALVARHTTNSDGAFVFNGLNPETSDYMVIAQDEDATDDAYKDAIVKDRIQPIYASQGSTYYRNWMKLACDNSAMSMFGALGVFSTASTTIRNISGVMSPTYVMASGGTTLVTPTFVESITPGAPDISGVKLTDQKIISSATGIPASSVCATYSTLPVWTAAAAASFEAVLNLTGAATPSLSTGIAYFGSLQTTSGITTVSGSDSVTVLCGFLYDVSAKTIQIVCSNGSTNYLASTSSYAKCGSTINISSYLDGNPHHFVVTVVWASVAKLYIDGVLVSTQAFTNGSNYVGSYNSSSYASGELIACGFTTNYASGTYGVTAVVGVMASYPSALSAAVVAELYEALMVGTTPELTGYSKDVVLDCPTTYIRLNEASGATAANEFLRPSSAFGFNYSTVVGSVTFGVDSPVTGGSLATFSGTAGIRFNYSAAYHPSPDGFTVEWVGKDSGATPSAIEYLFRVSDTSENLVYAQVYETTAKVLVLQAYLQGGTTETLTFSSVTLDGALHHYAISVNKVSDVAILYIDGVAVSTISSTTTLGLYTAYAQTTYFEMHIGGIVSDTNVVTNGCKWTFGELAIYPAVLSATRIASHVTEMDTESPRLPWRPVGLSQVARAA